MINRLINICIVVIFIFSICGCAQTTKDTPIAETENVKTENIEIEDEEETNAETAEYFDKEITIEGIKGKPYMLQDRVDKLLLCYDNYIEFVKAINIYQEDCGRLPASVHVRTWRNKLHILHLNTTLISDGKTKKGQMTDTFTATSDEIREKLKSNSLPCIAIGHNSFFDLSENQQDELRALFLQENISAYLCGDRHKKFSKREENHIILSNKLSSIYIPNIVSYRTSTDEEDTYSDFGMIWQLWDEDTDHVSLEFMKWETHDQGELHMDGNSFYNFREDLCTPQIKKKVLKEDDEKSCWYTNDDLEKKSKLPVHKKNVKKFLLYGGGCGWNLAFSSNWIVKRNIVDNLYRYALDGGIYALTGPGGEGKTTILMQMCAKLVKEVPVFYYSGCGRIELPADIPEGSVFIWDNPPSTPKFKQFINTMIENEYTLIIGARENEWNLLKKAIEISDRDIQGIPMQKLTAKESWAFADCVCNNLRHTKERKEIKEIFLSDSYGFLYAAMLLAVSDKNSLAEIANDIIAKLLERSRKGLYLLAHIVLSEQFEVKYTRMQFRDTCRVLELSQGEGNRALSREITLNGDIYQTRHEIISKLFFKELFSDKGLLKPQEVDDILKCLLDFHFNRYRLVYGNLADDTAKAIVRLSGGLVYASLVTQQYLIARILDEIKFRQTNLFRQLPLYIGDEDVQLLFFRQCFDRELMPPDFVLKWCHLLLKRGAHWTVLEPYSPA